MQSATPICSSHFISKLRSILEDCELKNIIKWTQSGLQFELVDPLAFQDSVVPMYFRHASLKSFVRQLNMYGFRKVARCKQNFIYHHPLFTQNSSNDNALVQLKLTKKKRQNKIKVPQSTVTGQQQSKYNNIEIFDDNKHNTTAQTRHKSCQDIYLPKIESKCFIDSSNLEKDIPLDFSLPFSPLPHYPTNPEIYRPIDCYSIFGMQEESSDFFPNCIDYENMWINS